MFPLLYQVWSAAGDEEIEPLVTWWAGRHARSMLSVGFLGAHQYRSTSDGRRPFCNFYEIPDMDIFGEEYHAATLADLPFLVVPGDKYQASSEDDLQHLAASGSTATIYEQLAVYGPEGVSAAPAFSLAAAVTAPCASVYGFAGQGRSETVAWFESTFLTGPPIGCDPYVNVRLACQHSEQHPISPLPTEKGEWLLLAQWPNRAVGERSHAAILRAIEDASDQQSAAPTSDLLVNGVSLINSSGWEL